ncbi:L-aminoadipate-semialdehyde dehydrogenase-phosphopantetheinyl transferase [Parasteatoda tepidariorum]|uniref:L-aminoadipate-semialdehyde dehydrogenase-phosphopantetheinyl transferase n=1 Tax=Parasteatoda tepidariorum TaxID=114398 RepID=UPI00077F86F0|nr:L-aminoadipate-semialdehyde dehydrogenase-phosphopantetheinyl transferase [Parasteatoda tepidariorum]
MSLQSTYSNVRWAFNFGNWKPLKEHWKLAVQCIQKEERERCYQFCFVEDCKASLIGRLLMRKAASESCALPYDKLHFLRTSSGKPFLGDTNINFSFNISHNGDFCVLAASKQSMNIGVDVMKIEHRGRRTVEEFFTTMKKQFSSYEWDFISQPGFEIEQLGRFYRLWCLKESYVKAVGTGISCDLQKISFHCQTPVLQQNIITIDTKLYLEGIIQPKWRFEETFLDNNHCVAVALEPNNTGSESSDENFDHSSSCFTILSFEDLMINCKPFENIEQSFWEAFQSKNQKSCS